MASVVIAFLMAFALASALVFSIAGEASAQTPPLTPPHDAAAVSISALLRKGAAASARGHYEACVEAYSAAFSLAPAHVTAAELGLCEEALGRFVEAHDHLLFSLEGELPQASAGAKPAWKRYHAALDRISDRLARVIVFVRPNDAEVFLDGRSLGHRVSGRYFAVLPGLHTWSAQLEGYAPDQLTHTVRAGDLPDITLSPRAIQPDPSQPSGSQQSSQQSAQQSGPAIRPSPMAGTSIEARAGPLCDAACIETIRGQLQGKVESWRRERMDPSLALMAGGLLTVGFTADVGPGFWVAGEAKWGPPDDIGFSIGAEVRTVLPTSAGDRGDGKPLDIAWATFAASPCLRYKWAAGCGVIDIGLAFVSTAPGVSYSDDGDNLIMFGFGPRLAADIAVVEHLGIKGFADLRFSPLEETGFRVDMVPVWRNPIVSGLVGLGLSFR